MNNYDYPAGSDTPEAPWNQSAEEVAATVNVSQTLQKDICLIDYGNLENIDWKDSYKEQHFTPLQLIKYCEEFAGDLYDIYRDESTSPYNLARLHLFKRIIDDCKNWEEVDLEVV